MYQYYEYKYLVEPRHVEYVKNILDSSYGNSDPFEKGWVSSVYFDSFDRRSVEECANGQEIKRKFRIRAYEKNFEDNLQIQIKEKNLSAVRKYKSRSGVKSLWTWPKPRFIDDETIQSLTLQYCNLEPIVKIDYYRHRYRIQNARVTLDEMISVSSLQGLREFVTDEINLPFAVLEVKTRSQRPFLPLYGLVDLKQVSFSKFYLGVQCLKREEEALNKYLV